MNEAFAEKFRSAKDASRVLAQVPDAAITDVLRSLAGNMEQDMGSIIDANKKDRNQMKENDPKYDRLLLMEERIRAMMRDVLTVSALPSPVGRIIESRTRPNGLVIEKISTPFGVIGIVYEARPNVTVDSFALCLKSRNACVLKGGNDAAASNEALGATIHRTLREAGLPEGALVQLPSDHESKALEALLQARGFVDLLIPRGGKGLIERVREEATVPVIETGAGIVHTYVDSSADIPMAAAVVCNAKTRRPGVCNALDTVLIHQEIVARIAEVLAPLAAKGVRVFADDRAFAHLADTYDAALLEHAMEEHFGTEFLSLKLAVATVDDLGAALAHIRTYSSGHSEAVVAQDKTVIERFLREVDAAVVYANASTAFTDGGEFGMGAEIGISTQKLHARGPMGLEALTTYKSVVRGNGQTRE
ncbi:MAG: glutamate-5-semialdehyde dehydrogenase [Candidatus Peribacteraceae bacterium]|nr:glutamate-5-semialdehyde dehydrogenase [Candidatus Peribacteraceae bacterium]